MAYVYLFRNEVAAGLAEAEKTLGLNPNCLLMMAYPAATRPRATYSLRTG